MRDYTNFEKPFMKRFLDKSLDDDAFKEVTVPGIPKGDLKQ
jgi:hypothetical protein